MQNVYLLSNASVRGSISSENDAGRKKEWDSVAQSV
jgi:hypothetical protein